MKASNFMEVKFKAISVNEGLARICVAGFCLQLNPSVEELGDIKTAVSEAVTNCVVHAYPKGNGIITLRCRIEDGYVMISVSDNGIGIQDIEKARQPFFTTKPSEDRSGMGFAVMESFMDKLDVKSNIEGGITVTMYKKIENALQVENAW